MTVAEEEAVEKAYLAEIGQMFHNFLVQLFLLAKGDVLANPNEPSPEENLRFGLAVAEGARDRMKNLLRERRTK